MTTDYEITLNSVPMEVLANDIFKFFEFRDWLKYLVPVCKQWRQAAVESQQEKLIRLDLSKNTIFNARYLISYYSVTSLILNGNEMCCSIYQLESIINASPMVKTVAFVSPCESFGTLKFDTDVLPTMDDDDEYYDPKIYMNHVTTVKVPYSCCSLLCMFPNAERVSLCKNPHTMEFVSTRVTEVEISTYYYWHDWGEFVTKMKNENFPNMKKLYMVINKPVEHFENVRKVAKDLGIELICRIPIAEDRETISKNGPLFCDDTSFPSSLERVTQWNNIDNQFFRRCHSLQTLPFWISIRFDIEDTDNEEKGKEAAIESLKRAHPVKLDSFAECHFVFACAAVLVVLSPHRILQEVGREKLRIMLNGWQGSSTVLYNFMQAYNHRRLLFDLMEFKDIIETKTLTKLHEEFVDKWHYGQKDSIAAVVRQIDALLTERQVDGFGSLPVDIIFKTFSYGNCRIKDIPSIAKLFKIDLNQTYDSDGNTLLSLAIADGELENIQKVLKLGIDVNKPDQNGFTPLIKAIQYGNEGAIELLLQNGADPNIAGDALNPLHLALVYAHHISLRIVNMLLFFGANINLPYINAKGRAIYPICVAMHFHTPGNVQKVQHLILRGANPNVTDEGGNTLLHATQNAEVLSLLGKYIDINTANKLGRTPLHSAIMSGSPCVAPILSLGADVNQCDMFGCTPLMMAMKFSCTKETLNPLLATKKVNIKARDGSGHSFVTYSVKHSPGIQIHDLFNCEEFVQTCQHYLTYENVQFIIDECKTLLSEWKDLSKAFKIITCHITVTKFFIEKVGLDVNHSDVLGNTLISSMKVNDESKNVIEYLVAKGAKLNSELMDELFKAPVFQWQAYQKMKLLLKYGVKPTDTNKNCVSLMDIDPESKLEQDLHPDYFNCYQPYDLSNILSFVRK